MNARFTFYCHTNRVNGKRYVGQTLDTVDGRWASHVSAARGNRGSRLIGAAIRKYGADAFEHEVLEVAYVTQEEANLLEMRWIERKQSLSPHGYNLSSGGKKYSRHHVDTRKLIGEAARRHIAEMSPERLAAYFKTNIHHWTPARLARHLDRLQTESFRAKLSTGQRDFWLQFSPEEKSVRVRHQLDGMSPEDKSARVKKAWANMSPEARAARVRKAQARGREVGPLRSEKMRAFQLARQATLTPEQRSETGRKAWVTRVAKYGTSGVKDATGDRNGSAGMTPEARSERIRKGWSVMTPEARANRVHKIQEGRRRAREKKMPVDAELVPFVRHWHRRGYSIESIATTFDRSREAIEMATA